MRRNSCYTSFKDYLKNGRGHSPGDRIQREDGNTYTVCGDGFSLKDSEGFYVLTDSLERMRDQVMAGGFAESDIDTSDSIYPEVNGAY